MVDPKELYTKASAKKAENQLLFRQLARMDARKLDELVHRLHEEVFEEINCLECANCCRSLGPRITEVDISRISSNLQLKPAQLLNEYLRKDEDGDFVFKSMPCPFLDSDNYCNIYETRPRACREYPHTDRRRFFQLLPLSLKNTYTCPAVFEIVERIKTEMKK